MSVIDRRASVAAVVCVLALLVSTGGTPSPARAGDRKPSVWMCPPSYDKGRCFRELFEQPDAWKETRSQIDVLGYTDLHFQNHFRDDELRDWFRRLRDWNIKLALEVGAVKPWGKTGENTFKIERPMWERIERLGGRIHAVAMDEPLLCVRRELKKTDEFAIEETARYIAKVREHFPHVQIGDIEPYPTVKLDELTGWIEALQKRLAEKKVRGLDFFRLDVNWVEFTVFNNGTWRDVRKLEQYCRRRGIEFSLIYWASDYPPMKSRGLADDATWYVSLMAQGYAYAAVDGAPDQYVLESWIEAPSHSVPESAEWSFTRSVLDFTRRFVKRKP